MDLRRDLVIAFALPVEVATVRPQKSLHLRRVVRHLVSARDKFAVRKQVDRNIADRGIKRSTVGFKQLGDHGRKFFRQSFDSLGFGDESRNIVAGRDLDFRLGVPFSINCDLPCSHLTKV
jgi:hypothetical protein